MSEKNSLLSLEDIPGYYFSKDLQGVYTACNPALASIGGLQSHKDIVGKTDYELPWREQAELLREHDQEVTLSGCEKVFEEFVTLNNGNQVTYLVTKKPIFDNDSKVIGLCGFCIDITRHKHKEKMLTEERDHAAKQVKDTLLNLEQIIAAMPGSVYWKNCDGVYLGCNAGLADLLGMSKFEVLGKTDRDFAEKLGWPKEILENFINTDQEIIASGKPRLNFEEPPFKFANGKIIYQLDNKVPLRNENDEVIGIVGVGIDITARKKAEAEATQLKIENTAHKVQLEADAQFAKLANQVVHDIRSPLSSLMIIVKHCRDLPETERIALREAARGIGDIANNLLNQYQADEIETTIHHEERKPVLLSATILQLLTDKRFQYKELPVQFEDQISRAGQFAFIQTQPSAFKRMISNLINNAVDAFENKSGAVTVKLDASPELVRVIVEDNGKGMPPQIVDKIMQNIAFTAGKSDGHGIGLTQVRDTLQANEGRMSIQSTEGKGTQIILEFPHIETPDWIAKEIKLNEKDRVIILDDDSSIHGAWDTRFESILDKASGITVQHFEICHDALDYIRQFDEDEKQKIYLLTDYELLKQELNGLNVVERAGIQRSMLVTSHYNDPIVLDLASKMGTKILPKQLASEIPIDVDTQTVEQKNVDLVLVSDDKTFSQTLMRTILKDKKIDYFEDPSEFQENVNKYPKNTCIYVSNSYMEASVRGIDIAEYLHELSYTNLYLLTGHTFASGDLPSYLIPIRKDEIDKLRMFVEK